MLHNGGMTTTRYSHGLSEVSNDTPVAAPLSAIMIAALTEAASDDNGGVIYADRRTTNALFRRGLVDLTYGHGTNRRGGTAYDVYHGARVNNAGRAMVAELQAAVRRA